MMVPGKLLTLVVVACGKNLSAIASKDFVINFQIISHNIMMLKNT